MEAQKLQTLTGLVKKSGLTRAGFESLVLKLGPQESRMFSRLLDGPAGTVEIRNGCSIGNVSEVRSNLNRKLEAAGDPRRVVCSVEPHVNRFGDSGRLGVWRLIDAHAANEGGVAPPGASPMPS
mgnify:CR=1 FL=1